MDGTSELWNSRIGRTLRKYNIKPIFRPNRKLVGSIRPYKDRIPFNAEGVYKIPCSHGKVCIGQSWCFISTRLKDHVRHTRSEDSENSAVVDHSVNTKHINFEEASIVNRASNNYKRIMLEAMEISKHRTIPTGMD